MIPFIALHLLLTAVSGQNIFRKDWLSSKSHAEYELPYLHAAGVSPDILNDNNFVVANYVYNSSLINQRYRIPLEIQRIGLSIKSIGPQPNSTKNECFVPFKRLLSILPIRRLSYKTVLIATHAHNDKEHMKLVLVNIKNCNYTYAYNGSLPKSHLIFKSNNVNDDSFTLIVSDQKFCKGHEWCRLFFNPFYQKSEPLNFDFYPHELRNIDPVTSANGSVFIVGLNGNTNSYSLRLYDSTEKDTIKYKELDNLDNYKIDGLLRYEVISSSLSYCWKVRLEQDIHCTVFGENGQVMLKKTIYYREVVRLLHLQSIPNGLILISSTADCLMEQVCPTVRVTLITKKLESPNSKNCSKSSSTSTLEENESLEIKYRQYDLKCPAFDLTAMKSYINLTDNSIVIDYLCRNLERISLNHFYSKLD